MAKPRVTLTDIAREVGVTAQTVSLALRGHRRISQATRDKVRAVAESMGYQPDPALTVLASYRTQRKRRAGKWETLAVVDTWREPEAWSQTGVYRRLRLALETEAARRGIRLEHHWLGERGSRAEAAFRVVRNRGIHGVIVAPMPITEKPDPITLPSAFQYVTFGPEHLFPDLHVIQPDFYENMRLIWAKLTARGLRRIGLVMTRGFSWRTGEAWLGAYWAEKQLAGFAVNDLPPLVFEQTAEESLFRRWCRREKPDAIVTINPQVLDWTARMRPRPVIAWLSTPQADGLGVDPNPELMARTAIEILLIEMQRALSDEEGVPFRIHVPGRWVAEESLHPTQAGQGAEEKQGHDERGPC